MDRLVVGLLSLAAACSASHTSNENLPFGAAPPSQAWATECDEFCADVEYCEWGTEACNGCRNASIILACTSEFEAVRQCVAGTEPSENICSVYADWFADSCASETALLVTCMGEAE